MISPEIAQGIGIAKTNKTISNMPMRNCPIYLDNALSTLSYFLETQFQYVKDIQIESAMIGFTALRDSPHISKYVEIMKIVEYGNNPDVHITPEQRSKKDRFEFIGSIIKGVTNFKISDKTRDSLFALAQKIDMDSNNVDFMAYLIGYQEMFSHIDDNLLNNPNKELLNILTKERKRIDDYLRIRTIHKIIDYCPSEIDYNNSLLKWRF